MARKIQIAYIGGGSRGWAWKLMSDLAVEKELCGEVRLYDIDYQAAKDNEIIGNRIGIDNPGCDNFSYRATETIGEALTGADFVVISILPGTFDEMESDVHTPEKYGIYQSVGDTAGPGGIVRALRTIPMMEEIAKAVEKYSPDAWVINYTNPMTLSIRALYNAFPKIKAFGCCHEVFGTQRLLSKMLKMEHGIEAAREDIHVIVTGINHFTWITKATYQNKDLFPLYKDFCAKYHEEGVSSLDSDTGAQKSEEEIMEEESGYFTSMERVKMELFMKYGYIAAAGDRHLVEFLPGGWYLENPERVKEMMFGLTPVSYRKEELKLRLRVSQKLRDGVDKFMIETSGEEGVKQMKAILGMGDIVTNVNMPNVGQIPNLPLGAVVETNAHFTADTVTPVCAGPVPMEIYGLIAPQCANQEVLAQAAANRDLETAFRVFAQDPNVRLSLKDARALFDEMIENTKAYLGEYFK